MALNFLSDGYFAGSLGIGTDSPGAKLDIVSSASGSQIELTSPTPGIKLIDSNAPTRYAEIKTENGNVTIDIDPGGAEGNSRFSIDIDNDEMFRVTDDGYVGIGDQSPESRLTVACGNTSRGITEAISIKAGDLYEGDGVSLSFKLDSFASGIFPNWFLGQIGGVYEDNTGFKGALFFKTSSSHNVESEKMRITSGGNVGIGTEDPKSKLEVDGGVKIADDTDAASVDKVGTMRYKTGTEYVEVTGVELVTNGGFGADESWTSGSLWTISGGKANYTNTSTDKIYQAIALTNAVTYRVKFTVSGVSGSSDASIWIGDSTGNTNYLGGTYKYYANGDFEEIFTMPSSQTTFTFYSRAAGSSFSLDNVTLMEVTAEDASYADMCMQTGASTYEWVNIVRNTY